MNFPVCICLCSVLLYFLALLLHDHLFTLPTGFTKYIAVKVCQCVALNSASKLYGMVPTGKLLCYRVNIDLAILKMH